MGLTIKFYDVEHGSCTHLVTPNGKHILVDVGSKTDKSIIAHIKNRFFSYGGSIDQLIITHPHEDHIWDIPCMYKLGLKPRVLLRPKNAFDIVPQQNTALHIEIAKYANAMNQEYSQPIASSEDPLFSDNNGGVDIKVISSPSWAENKSDLNTFSSFVIVEYCGYKFVLCGDNPSSVVNEMLKYNVQGIKTAVSDATVLLAPHHGRTGEFCESFFSLVNPRLTVISDKSIVHGTQEQSSQKYRGRGVRWDSQDRYSFTTRNDGTITVEITDHNKWSINTSFEEYK